MRVAFGVFLVLHALIHLSWFAPVPGNDPKWPFDLAHSRLVPGLAEAPLRAAGIALIAVTVVAFAVAALGAFGVSGLASVWRTAAIVGAVGSLAVTALFWAPWFVASPVLNAAIIAAMWWEWV